MNNKTISLLPGIETVDGNDFFIVWDTSSNTSKKINKNNLQQNFSSLSPTLSTHWSLKGDRFKLLNASVSIEGDILIINDGNNYYQLPVTLVENVSNIADIENALAAVNNETLTINLNGRVYEKSVLPITNITPIADTSAVACIANDVLYIKINDSIYETSIVQTQDNYYSIGTISTPVITSPLTVGWSGSNYTVFYGADGTINLPTAINYTGRAITIYNTGSYSININPKTTDGIIRDGSILSIGTAITLSPGIGNYVTLICDSQRWVTLNFKGVLV